MDDFIAVILGLFACSLPFALVFGVVVVWAIRAGQSRKLARTSAEVEAMLGWLSAENAALARRVSQLEAIVMSLRDGQAASPVTSSSQASAAEAAHDVSPPIGAASSMVGAAGPDVASPLHVLPPLDHGTDAPVPVRTGEEDASPRADQSLPESSSDAPPTGDAAGHVNPPQSARPITAPSDAPPQSPHAPGTTLPAPSGSWERWIGVRGAAALGASILVLAGIYFFEYSIEHGLLTPAMRMIAGTLVGLGCVVASELHLRRTYPALASWIAGAGVAILYVAFWAGAALYELYPSWAAGILMVAVTGTCVALALVRESPAIAVLGLLGGFVTPLALSAGSDHPIPLFGYLLLLDGAMLWVAHKRRWAWMALVCLAFTAVYQNAWLITRLDEPRVVLGVVIVGLFAVLFAGLPRTADEAGRAEESVLWKLARSAGVLLPLFFTIPLAVRRDLGGTFWPTAVQLILLCSAACWVGVRHASALLPSGAALLAVGTILGWTLGHEPDTALEVWQIAGLALAVALVFHGAAELDRLRSSGRLGPKPAWLVVLAMLAVAALGACVIRAGGLWPWLALYAGLAASGMRLGSFPGRARLQLGVAALAALGLGGAFLGGAGHDEMPPAALFVGLLVFFAAAMQLAGLLHRDEAARAHGDHAAALFALVLVPLIAMVIRDRAVPAWAFYAATSALTVLAIFAAVRRSASFWLPLVLVATAVAHGIWVARRASGPFELLELGMLFGAVVLFSLIPILAPRATREAPWAWRTAALAGPLHLLALRHVWLDVLGPAAIGALPLLLAVLSIGAAAAVRARGPNADEARRTALIWLLASAAGFVTLAIPLQLEREWITIGWSLEALALTLLWRRSDHAGLKYLAFALAAVVGVRLVLNPYVLGYYERSPVRIFNWLSYTYLVPAAALFGIWALSRALEVERRRAWEKPFFPSAHPILAQLAAGAAFLVLFVWVNLTIVDWYLTGPELTIPTERLAARDLSMSIAWALFALALLGIGLARKSTALRVTSLGLVLVTCGKVFLYDLAHLSDLYRVASLAGLAVSLIVISFVYQRFVFRSASAPPEEASR